MPDFKALSPSRRLVDPPQPTPEEIARSRQAACDQQREFDRQAWEAQMKLAALARRQQIDDMAEAFEIALRRFHNRPAYDPAKFDLVPRLTTTN